RPGADLFVVFVTAHIHLLAAAIPPFSGAVGLVVRFLLLGSSTPIVVEAGEAPIVTAILVLDIMGLLAIDEPGCPRAGKVLRRLDVNCTRLLGQRRECDHGIDIAKRHAEYP